MPVAPAIPLIAQGVGALVGHFAGKKATSAAQKRSDEENVSLEGGQETGAEALSAGTGLMKQGRPMIADAGNYYKTLLHGNRAAMGLATAAPRASITDSYRGAARNLDQSGIRGAAKDVHAGELNRQRAGQIAGLTTGVQPAAAEALGNLGTETTRTGVPLYNTAGNVYTNLLGQGSNNRQYARREGENTGAAIGSLIRDVGGLAAKRWPGGGGGAQGPGPWRTGQVYPPLPDAG